MDETGLFYKTIPSKTACKKSRKGHKNFKDGVSVMLCANMTGCDKIKPMIIGKSVKPRCFTKNVNLRSINYTSSNRAWMTSTLFNMWLKGRNDNLKLKDRQFCCCLIIVLRTKPVRFTAISRLFSYHPIALVFFSQWTWESSKLPKITLRGISSIL